MPNRSNALTELDKLWAASHSKWENCSCQKDSEPCDFCKAWFRAEDVLRGICRTPAIPPDSQYFSQMGSIVLFKFSAISTATIGDLFTEDEMFWRPIIAAVAEVEWRKIAKQLEKEWRTALNEGRWNTPEYRNLKRQMKAAHNNAVAWREWSQG